MPYTSINGHMFSYLDSQGTLALRLPEPERDLFLNRYNTTLASSYGIVQKEYVSVPASLLNNAAELRPYLLKSFEYVKTLKPKPQKTKSVSK